MCRNTIFKTYVIFSMNQRKQVFITFIGYIVAQIIDKFIRHVTCSVGNFRHIPM